MIGQRVKETRSFTSVSNCWSDRRRSFAWVRLRDRLFFCNVATGGLEGRSMGFRVERSLLQREAIAQFLIVASAPQASIQLIASAKRDIMYLAIPTGFVLDVSIQLIASIERDPLIRLPQCSS